MPGTGIPLRPLPPLTALARVAFMLVKHSGQLRNAIGEAEALYRDQPQVALALQNMLPHMIDAEQKATVNAIGISSSPLATSGVLLEALPIIFAKSAFGALRERAIPVPLTSQAAIAPTAVGSTWIAEGNAKPAAAFTLGHRIATAAQE